MVTLVYTLPGCNACDIAKRLLVDSGEPFREIAIDNPLLELGVMQLFSDRQVHAPVVLRPGQGAFSLGHSGGKPMLFKIVEPT